MIYVKSVLFGIGAAVAASVLWIVVAFVLPIWAPFAIGRLRGSGGMSGASISSRSVLLAAVLGFLVASALSWSKLRSASK